MYEIYAVIGVVLIVTGATSSVYFTLQMKRSKYKKGLIERLSDGLGTLFLGIFYLYCYSLLSQNTNDISTILSFPDIEETYLNVSNEETMNSDIFTPVTNIHIDPVTYVTSTTHEVFVESNKIQTEDNNVFTTTEILKNEVIFSTLLDKNETITINKEVTQSPFVETSGNDTFKFYQNYFKDILGLKSANDSKFENRTFFFNNTEYSGLKNRTKRDVTNIMDQIFIKTNEQCFKILFLKHSLLICSFLYSSICLINNTKLCYTDKNGSKVKSETSNENPKQKDESEISSQNLDGSSGELFAASGIAEKEENKISPNVNDQGETNFDIFLAKNSNSIDLREKNKGQSSDRLNSIKYQSKLPQVIKLLVIWFTPGVCIYSLHMIMETTNPLSLSSMTDIQYNFNSTRANNEMLKLLNSPLNVTTHGKTKEINDIVKSVYNIVERATKHSKTKSSSMNVIYDIVHFMNDKFHKRNNTEQENCKFNTISLKLHSFILFFLMYFSSILYSKILQLKMKQEQNEYTNLMRLYIFMFSIIWLPGILELFSRIYVFNKKPSAAAGTTLALGNLFVVFNNLNNYLLNSNVKKIKVNVKI